VKKWLAYSWAGFFILSLYIHFNPQNLQQMQMAVICILVAGAYLTGRFVTKGEYEEKLDDLRTDHDTLKRAFNKLIQEEEKQEETSLGTKQGYWEVEDEFHNFNHTE
jgi:hypothetical protein